MGWLSSVLGTDKTDDPLGKLDPKLREFLEKEAPVKYTPNQPTPPPVSTPSHDEKKPVSAPPAEKPVVPSESLYQDGRYAHLWKNYRPLAQIEAETATDHERLMGVLEGFKERKAAIGRAAMENCSLQQEEWVNCMKNGSWEDQLVMCKHQVRRFERCYTMQSRFLRALGYGSVQGRPPQVEDDIQMHSDSLYQRMLAHEAAVEKAKQDGTAVPVFDMKLPQPKAVPTEEVEKTWKEKLDKLPEDERAVEEAALRADLDIKLNVARDVKKILDSKADERQTRQAEGQATIMDSIASLFGGGKK